MDNIYVIRERIEAVYGKHSKSFDKAFQFILAMITFTMINQNTGFMKSLSSPVISLGLAVVATFLPPAVMVVLATILLMGIYIGQLFAGTGTYKYGLHDAAVPPDSRSDRNICSDISCRICEDWQ